jgi:glyoxylate reductase
MNVVYHNRNKRPDEDDLNVKYISFDDLLANADFIVVMVPLSPESQGMFGQAQFAKMRTSTYFINAARGALVDTGALYDALRKGQIAYAAIDVTDPEPLPSNHPLLSLPNILVTPHIGTATAATRDAMACLAAENLLAGLAQKPLLTCVNKEVNYR